MSSRHLPSFSYACPGMSAPSLSLFPLSLLCLLTKKVFNFDVKSFCSAQRHLI